MKETATTNGSGNSDTNSLNSVKTLWNAGTLAKIQSRGPS